MKGKAKLKTSVIVFVASLLVLAYFLPTANAVSTWHVVSNPKENSPVKLTSISIVSQNDIWVVGWLGTILHWNGVDWQPVSCPVGYDLSSIQMINSTDGWITGAGATMLHWNGKTWNKYAIPTDGNPFSLSMVNGSDGWALCGMNNAWPQTHFLHWDGNSWSIVSNPVAKTLESVFMLSSTDGWAVGESGVILHWNGVIWSRVSSPTSLPLLSVFMLSSTNGWAVGHYESMSQYNLLHWDGTAWSLFDSPSTLVGTSLNAIYMVNENDGWAAGADVLMHWDGLRWNLEDFPFVNSGFCSFAMLSSGEGWGVGSEWVQIDYQTWEQRARIFYYGQNSPQPPLPPPDVYGGTWLSKFKNIILKAGSAQNIGLFEDCAATVPAADSFQNIQQGGSYEFSLYVLNTGTAPVYITYLPTDVNTNGGQTRFHINVNVIQYGLPCEMIANNIPLPAGVSSLPFALPEKDVTNPTSGFPLNPNKMIKLDINIRVDSIDLSSMPEMGWNIPFEVVSVSV